MKSDNKKRSLLLVLPFILFALIFISFSLSAAYIFSTALRRGASGEAVNATPISQKTIVIDAGHGGEDPGAIGFGGVLEKDLNLNISRLLSELFTLAGYRVIETRVEDVLLYDRNADFEGRKKILDLKSRLDIGKASDCDLFISIHMNSFSQSQYSGLSVYYSKASPLSLEVAQNVNDVVTQKLKHIKRREIKAADSRIYLLDRADYPAILVECGFLSNPEECAKLAGELYQQKLALLIFCAVDEALQ